MIFLTVGTEFPFERLIKAVDSVYGRGLIDGEIFAQIGEGSYRPRNFRSVAFLEKKVFDNRMKEASRIISHAGVGTITMALDKEKPLLVMPRLRKYGEHVNDHQIAFAKRFEELGHILVAYDVEELPDRIHELKNFTPRKRKASPHAVADRIRHFLNDLSEPRHA